MEENQNEWSGEASQNFTNSSVIAWEPVEPEQEEQTQNTMGSGITNLQNYEEEPLDRTEPLNHIQYQDNDIQENDATALQNETIQGQFENEEVNGNDEFAADSFSQTEMNQQITSYGQPRIVQSQDSSIEPETVQQANPYGQPEAVQQASPYGQPEAVQQASPYSQPGMGQQASPYSQPGMGQQASPYSQSGMGQQASPYSQPGMGQQASPYSQSGMGQQASPYSQPGMGQQANPYSQPGMGQQPSPYSQPGMGQQPNPYSQPGVSQQQNPYGQRGAGQQANPYMQPGVGQQPSPYSQPGVSQQQNPYGQRGAGQQQNPYMQPAVGQQQNPYMQPGMGQQNPYGQPSFSQANQYPQNSYGQDKKAEKKGKKGVVIGIIAAIVIVVGMIAAGIYFAGVLFGDDSLPKNQEKFTYSEGIKTKDYVDAYYEGKISNLEKAAELRTYDDLMNHSNQYLKKVIAFEGTVSKVDTKNGYIYLSDENGKEVVFYDARDTKNSVTQGSKGKAYATYYEVTTLKSGDKVPCCILWELESLGEDTSTTGGSSTITETDDVTVTGGTTTKKEFPEFTYEDGTPEKELIDSMKYLEMPGKYGIYLLFGPKDEQTTITQYGHISTYVAFCDKDDNILAVQNDASYIYPGQQSSLMVFNALDEKYEVIEYDHYKVSCDVTINSTAPEFTFEDVDFQCKIEDGKLVYEATNKTDKDMYLEVIVVYVKDDMVVNHQWLTISLGANQTLSEEEPAYSGEIDDFSYVFNRIM